MKLRTRLAAGMGGVLLAMTLGAWVANSLLLEPLYRWQRENEVVGLVRELVAQPYSPERAREVIGRRDPERAVMVYIVGEERQTVFESRPLLGAEDSSPQPGSAGAKPPPPPRSEKDPFYPVSEFHALGAGETATMIKREPGLGGTFLLGLGRFSGGESVIASIPLAGIRESARLSSVVFAVTGLVFLVPALALVFWLSRRITRPLEELSEYTKQLGGLDFRPAPDVSGTEEVTQLGLHMKAMARSLEGEVDRQRALDDMRREFISNASHELKTPLTLIQGFAEGLAEGIADDPAKRAQYLGVILDEVKTMDRHVRDLLELTSWESGARTPDWVSLDAAEVVRTCAERFAARWEGGDAAFDLPPLEVVADRNGLDQIVGNFLTNALDHGAEPPLIRVVLRSTGETWRLEVFNAGPLLPPGEEDCVWLSYHKADKSRRRGFGGTGLGLAIVKGIVATHGGVCGCANEPAGAGPAGVRFWVELPRLPPR